MLVELEALGQQLAEVGANFTWTGRAKPRAMTRPNCSRRLGRQGHHDLVDAVLLHQPLQARDRAEQR